MRQRADEVTGWWLDSPIKAEIDRILRETITDPKIVVITGFSLV
jgi:hypothetical protein